MRFLASLLSTIALRMARWMAVSLSLLVCCAPSNLQSQTKEQFGPTIPKVWDDTIMKDLEIPLAKAEYSPQPVPESFYYQIPEKQIYKSYAVYDPAHEPKGYIEWLRSREPEIEWDSGKRSCDENSSRNFQVAYLLVAASRLQPQAAARLRYDCVSYSCVSERGKFRIRGAIQSGPGASLPLSLPGRCW
jgi:hypothetical protein